MKKILLPVDGSKALSSYNMAKKLALTFNATIIIMHVDEPIPPIYWANESLAMENPTVLSPNNAKSIVDQASKYFETDNIKIKKICKFGDASSNILSVSEEENVDIIIMCTHGMSAIKRFLLGSVTNKVVHHSKIPVLTVR